MVTWISDSDLDGEIQLLRERAKSALQDAEVRRVRNVVDPFLSLLLASTFDLQNPAALTNIQRAESAIRGMSNALGEFHQRILGSVHGWANHDAGYDLECSSRRIVAEVKNKWNTMNANARRGALRDLETAVRQKRGAWIAYLVIIVPKKPKRYEKDLGNNVIETDGASFYQKVTGEANAIHDLMDSLCDRITPSEDIADHCRRIMNSSLPPRLV